jgi:SPP1 gp7 family putative phage head morphogenesis protein
MATSTWQGLSGVTEQVNTQVAGVLADSLASRATLPQTAAAIRDRIDKIGVSRSELIARTETVQSNNMGALAEYDIAAEIIGEPVLVQWQATLDNRVRPHHLARHGKIFTSDEAAVLLGEPNCRCSVLPYIESVEGKAEMSKASTFKDLKTGKPKLPSATPTKPSVLAPEMPATSATERQLLEETKAAIQRLMEKDGKVPRPARLFASRLGREFEARFPDDAFAKFKKYFERAVWELDNPGIANTPSVVKAAKEIGKSVQKKLTAKKWGQSLDDAEKEAFLTWENSREVVDEIRSFQTGARLNIPKETLDDVLSPMTKALERAPDHKGVVYRGIRGDIDLSEGDTWVNDALTSATKSDDVATFYAGTEPKIDEAIFSEVFEDYDGPSALFEIHTVSGVDISSFSSLPEQQEVLLRSGSQYIIESIETRTMFRDDGSAFDTTYVVLREIL